MESKKPARYYYALMYPNYNFSDTYDLIRTWHTAALVRYPRKALRDNAVDHDERLVAVSAKVAAYIAGGNLQQYFYGW